LVGSMQNPSSSAVLDISEEPPLIESEEVSDSVMTINALATPDHPVTMVNSTMDGQVGEAQKLGIDMRANMKNMEAGVDLLALLSVEKKQTRVSLGKVIQLKQGMIEREARATREALQSNPEDVDELLRQLKVVKMTTDKISDDCYKKLKHMLHGMRNASKYKMPL